MTRITVQLLRKHAEHNDRMLTSLRDLSLHQLGIERIECINQMCRHLTRLYLHGNIISKIENLYRLKELQHLNLAMNNIQRVEGLERCESLRSLDLTLNFITLQALPSIASLSTLLHLSELKLVGNPCTNWEHYRCYVASVLPRLSLLDSENYTLEELEWGKRNQNFPLPASLVDRDSQHFCDVEQRIQERLENQKHREGGQQARCIQLPLQPERFLMPRRRPFRPEFPDLDGADDQQQPLNCNEGEWDYGLEEQEDGSNGSRSYLLTLHLQREILLDDIKLDLREKLVRILAAGCLFQIRLPEVVKSDAARASRSRATGKLRITMPIDQKGP